MSVTKCDCACQKIGCCKSCVYQDPSTMDPLKYDYFNQTWWNNWNTTNGWGPFPSSSGGQNNNTYDNLSGYGTRAPASTNRAAVWPWCQPQESVNLGNRVLPNGKKLVRVYKWNNRFYERSGDLVFYENNWVPVADIPNVEKTFRVISV